MKIGRVVRRGLFAVVGALGIGAAVIVLSAAALLGLFLAADWWTDRDVRALDGRAAKVAIGARRHDVLRAMGRRPDFRTGDARGTCWEYSASGFWGTTTHVFCFRGSRVRTKERFADD